MRSIALMAVSTLIVLGAWACGDDGGTGSNGDPVANFTVAACTAGTPCAFTDASTDPDGNNTITTRAWVFGDPASGTANQSGEINPTHTYSTAGTYTVTLTVTDNTGKTSVKTSDVTVTGGTGNNVPPTASFVLADPTAGCTQGTPCGFHSTSTDPDGDIAAATFNWDFGDGSTIEGADATHTYAAAGPYTVTLSVIDVGGAPASTTQQLTVVPAASQDCTTSVSSGLRIVSCSLTMTQRSTLRFTVQSRSCQLAANQLRVTAPRDQYIFFNLCTRPVGTETVLNDASGNPLVLEQGTQVAIRFEQGTGGPTDPETGDPGIRIDVPSANNWVLNIDDGGAPGTEGEPDFDDAVIGVTALAAP
jgi:PKD repeat protein